MPQDTTPTLPRPPACPHTVDNGHGITWHCALPPHDPASGHYMVADEVAIARAARADG